MEMLLFAVVLLCDRWWGRRGRSTVVDSRDRALEDEVDCSIRRGRKNDGGVRLKAAADYVRGNRRNIGPAHGMDRRGAIARPADSLTRV